MKKKSTLSDIVLIVQLKKSGGRKDRTNPIKVEGKTFDECKCSEDKTIEQVSQTVGHQGHQVQQGMLLVSCPWAQSIKRGRWRRWKYHYLDHAFIRDKEGVGLGLRASRAHWCQPQMWIAFDAGGSWPDSSGLCTWGEPSPLCMPGSTSRTVAFSPVGRSEKRRGEEEWAA